MNIINIQRLYKINYSVKVINALKQYKIADGIFNCIDKPKTVNMLTFISGFDAEYTLKSGRKIYAHSGDVVYVPVGAQYKLIMTNSYFNESYIIGINFMLTNKNDKPFVLSKEIKVFTNKDEIFNVLFDKVDKYSEKPVMNYGMMNAGTYEILFNLCEGSSRSIPDKYSIIRKGIMYIEQENDDISVKDIASMCNVSEVYFSKLFKEYSGMSPVKYRTKVKINKAKIYLKYEDLSVAEIAQRLSFGSVAYFIKIFKKYTGVTPLEWRRNKRIEA